MKYFLLIFSILSFSQQIKNVNFISAEANLVINEKNKSVFGAVDYNFIVVSPIDTVRIDAKSMTFTSVFINQKKVQFKNSGKHLLLFTGFKKGLNKLHVVYEAMPKQTLYFLGSKTADNLQIWTQGQGKYTSNWLPSFDDVNEKLTFKINVTFDANYKVISNGLLIDSFVVNNSEKTWCYVLKKPMSSYLVMLAVAKFNFKAEKSASKIVLENYFQFKDSLKYEFTYKYSKQIFDFLETEIGINYPWGVYRQLPIKDFLYAGMENTTSTLFAQDFVVDEIGFNDQNYINVNAHELAHQWFGNMVTAKSGKHHWLQEGFATFYALLAERKLFGDDYFYYQLYLDVQRVRQAAKSDTIPILSEKASALSFYQKGSLALFYLYEKVGTKKFQKIIKNYLNKYKFLNVETQDFLSEINKVAAFDVVNFENNWLKDYRFQDEAINNLLKKNKFIQKLYEIQNRKKQSFAENEIFFSDILKSNCFYALKTEIIYQIKNIPFEVKQNLIKIAINDGNLEVKKAVAQTITTIPITFKNEYETFLDAKSYEVKELALIKLFNQFVDSQQTYLEKASLWKGNNDLSLRITYLFLSQLNTNFDLVKKQNNFDELIHYTSAQFESSIRKNAFDAAVQLQPINDKVLENLINATFHFKWQFNKYAKDFVRSLLKIASFRARFEILKISFSNENKLQLQKFLDEKTQ